MGFAPTCITKCGVRQILLLLQLHFDMQTKLVGLLTHSAPVPHAKLAHSSFVQSDRPLQDSNVALTELQADA